MTRPRFARARNLPRAKGAKPAAGRDAMNKGETLYAEQLERLRVVGVVSAWWFEPFNWRMADNTYYRPDFLVMRVDGTLEIHEVKGRKNGKDGKPDTFWKEEDAWLKLKVVSEQAPFPLFVVYPRRDGGWETVTV